MTTIDADETAPPGQGMDADEVVHVIDWLEEHAVVYQVNGGWAVDALLGAQSRPHGDLDVFLDAAEVPSLMEWLSARGYAVAVDWRPIRLEMRIGDRAVDIHPMVLDEAGDGVQQGFGDESFVHRANDRAVGEIRGRSVVVASAERLRALRSGYELRPEDHHDLDVIQRLLDDSAVALRAADRAASAARDGRDDDARRRRMTGRLVVISGLPGVGKSSVAESFAARTGLVHLSVDVVEEAILGCGLPPGQEVGIAAYEAARALAELNLRHDRCVVVDAVNDSEEARGTWRAAASRTGSRVDFVHLVMSDAQEHERRLAARERDLVHVGEPTWADVQHRRAAYAAWSDEIIELETSSRTVDEVVDALVARLGAAKEWPGVADPPKT